MSTEEITQVRRLDSTVLSNSSIFIDAINLVSKSCMLSLSQSLYLVRLLRVRHSIEDIVLAHRINERGLNKYLYWRKLFRQWQYKATPTSSSGTPTASGKSLPVIEDTLEVSRFRQYAAEYDSRMLDVQNLSDDILTLGQFGEIVRDVVRTFQSHPFFHPNALGPKILTRILQALMLTYPSIGYCQGMNFVVANLMLARLSSSITGLDPYEDIIPKSAARISYGDRKVQDQNIMLSDISATLVREAEIDIYEIMCIVISKDGPLNMACLWSPDVPKMKLRVYQMDRLMQWTFPKLHSHFVEIQLAPEMLVSQWFLTLFSYTIPTSLTLRIWDMIFFGGWPAMFRVALSILYHLEESFLSKDLEGIGIMMKDWKRFGKNIDFLREGCEDEIISRARLMVVTDEILQQLQESYAMEMISMSQSSLETSSKEGSSPSKSRHFLPHLPSLIRGRSTEEDIVKRSVINSPSTDTKWLTRYGDGVSEDVATEMIRIRDDLITMEKQVDIDKQQIQLKLLKACENYRSIEELWNEITGRYNTQHDAVIALDKELRSTITRAQHIAENIAEYYERNRNVSRSSTFPEEGSHESDQNVSNQTMDDSAYDNINRLLNTNKSIQIMALAAVDSFDDSCSEAPTDDAKSIATHDSSSHISLTTSPSAISMGDKHMEPRDSEESNDDETADIPSDSLSNASTEGTTSQRRRYKSKISPKNVPWLSFKSQTQKKSIYSWNGPANDKSDIHAHASQASNSERKSNSVVSMFRAGFGRKPIVSKDLNQIGTDKRTSNSSMRDGPSTSSGVLQDKANHPPDQDPGHNQAVPSSKVTDSTKVSEAEDSDEEQEISLSSCSLNTSPHSTGSHSVVSMSQDHSNIDVSSSRPSSGSRWGDSQTESHAVQHDATEIHDAKGQHSSVFTFTNIMPSISSVVSSYTTTAKHEESGSRNIDGHNEIRDGSHNHDDSRSDVSSEHLSANCRRHHEDHDSLRSIGKYSDTSSITSEKSVDEPSTNISTSQRMITSSTAAFLSGTIGQITSNFSSLKFKNKGKNKQGNSKLFVSGSENDKFEMLAKESQRCQHEIISIHRKLQEAKEHETILKNQVSALKIELDEATEWKKRLCDQFQLLVEDANRGRKQKLQYVTESFMI